MTTQVNVEKVTEVAADELIAVTGDKTLAKMWDLADAVAVAAPTLHRVNLANIRRAAVAKAGHDEFWQVARLAQLGRAGQSWPKADRIAGVSLDAHLEAFNHAKNVTDATVLINKVMGSAKKAGQPSIREIRAEIGANGTTAQPPRVDKAPVGDLFRFMVAKSDDLKTHLRANLKKQEKEIRLIAGIFEDAVSQIDQLIAAGKPTVAAVSAPTKPVERPADQARKGRVKGL